MMYNRCPYNKLIIGINFQKWHCMSEYCTSVASCVAYTRVKIGSEIALLDAVYHVGPISIAVDATSHHFQFYSDGVYAERGCNSHSLNHAMLLVGYGVTYDGMEYWILKNRYRHLCQPIASAIYTCLKKGWKTSIYACNPSISIDTSDQLSLL